MYFGFGKPIITPFGGMFPMITPFGKGVVGGFGF